MKSSAMLLFATVLASVPGSLAQEATYISKSYSTTFTKGLVRTMESQQFLDQAPHQSFVQLNTEVPSKFSLRGRAGPVENQGSCGACWDFALTTTLRGTLAMLGRDPGRLSFNYLLNCATTMYGCWGGDFTAASYLVKPKGAPAYGSDGEYTGQQSSCYPSTPVASLVSYKVLGTGYGQAAVSFKDIAYVVGVLHQPVAIDINADQELMSYSGGVYNGCTGDTGVDHMVVVEGYDCESSIDEKGSCAFDSSGNLPAGVGTYLIRNSWGATWGDHGYVTMKATDAYGRRCNAVASDALYFSGN